MNVYKYEMKTNLKSMIYWLLVSIAFTIVFSLMFPSFKEESQVVLSMMQGFPPELLASLGFDIETFFQIEGYVGFLFIYILIIVGLQAANLSLGVFSREGRTKTLDFIFCKPKKRSYIFKGKIFAVLTYMVLNVILYIGTLLMIISVVESAGIDLSYIANLAISMFIFELFFVAVTSLLSVLLPKIKSVATTSVIVVMGFYIVQVIENFTESSILKYLNPFGLYNATEILTLGALDKVNLALGIIYIIVISALAFIIYCRKDIHTT